jgi:glycosyltransferase involved in cell wall biosynthesis
MLNHPWLSVLIPTYNGGTFLPFALNSIVTQSDENIECLIIDDGSTDATLEIVEAYQKKLTIKVLERERNGNWVANTNYGLSFAQGDYVCFLHQDDLWFRDRLRIMKAYIEQFPQVGFFVHASHFIDIAGNNLGPWRCPLPAAPVIIKPAVMTGKLLVQNFISVPAPIFKRELALEAGGLDESLWYTADWDLWLKLTIASDSLYCSKALSGFRIHAGSQTVMRSADQDQFLHQLESVSQKYARLWDAPESDKKKVAKISSFSIEINTALAGSFHGRKINPVKILGSFLKLGPSGWVRFCTDSRISERTFARLLAQLFPLNKSRFQKGGASS